jgi:hypothetical protein
MPRSDRSCTTQISPQCSDTCSWNWFCTIVVVPTGRVSGSRGGRPDLRYHSYPTGRLSPTFSTAVRNRHRPTCAGSPQRHSLRSSRASSVPDPPHHVRGRQDHIGDSITYERIHPRGGGFSVRLLWSPSGEPSRPLFEGRKVLSHRYTDHNSSGLYFRHSGDAPILATGKAGSVA